jgi:hypothetical protein
MPFVGDPVTGVDQLPNGRTRVRHGTVLYKMPGTFVVEFGHPRAHSRRRELFIPTDEGVQWIRGHHREGSHALNALLSSYKLAASKAT